MNLTSRLNAGEITVDEAMQTIQQGLKSMTIYDKTAELMGDANTAYGQYRAY